MQLQGIWKHYTVLPTYYLHVDSKGLVAELITNNVDFFLSPYCPGMVNPVHVVNVRGHCKSPSFAL